MGTLVDSRGRMMHVRHPVLVAPGIRPCHTAKRLSTSPSAHKNNSLHNPHPHSCASYCTDGIQRLAETTRHCDDVELYRKSFFIEGQPLVAAPQTASTASHVLTCDALLREGAQLGQARYLMSATPVQHNVGVNDCTLSQQNNWQNATWRSNHFHSHQPWLLSAS